MKLVKRVKLLQKKKGRFPSINNSVRPQWNQQNKYFFRETTQMYTIIYHIQKLCPGSFFRCNLNIRYMLYLQFVLYVFQSDCTLKYMCIQQYILPYTKIRVLVAVGVSLFLFHILTHFYWNFLRLSLYDALVWPSTAIWPVAPVQF